MKGPFLSLRKQFIFGGNDTEKGRSPDYFSDNFITGHTQITSKQRPPGETQCTRTDIELLEAIAISHLQKEHNFITIESHSSVC